MAIGSIPLSAHPDPKVRARHPVRKSQVLRTDDWNGNIDWMASTIGPHFSVLIERASIKAWLGIGRGAEVPSSFKNAPDARILNEIRAEYDAADTANRKPPNVKQIIKPVQAALRSAGFNASGKHIEELAGAEEFKKRRRRPGATVKSDLRRQGK
jgi:hypothetical protein